MTKAQRPNVLMIVTDQEQPWVLWPKSLKLPGRARLAERATHFRRFHISGTICSPCRSVLYTGQHWQATGIFDNIQRTEVPLFREDMATLGTMFQRLGYRTGYRGKWHVTFLKAKTPEEYRGSMRSVGFETYSDLPDANGPHDGYVRDPISLKDARDFFAEGKRDERPWFLALNYINPHDIMFFRAWDGQARKLRYSSLREAPQDAFYEHETEAELPPNFGSRTLEGKPDAIKRNLEVYKRMLGEIPEDIAIWRKYRQYYFNCLRDVDRHIDATLSALEASGQADNTIIVFTTDHGEMAGAHGLRDKGSAGFRELVNVPLLISHPESRAGRESTALMSQVDIAPTLLSLAGVDARERAEHYPDLTGHDMSEAILGGEGPRDGKGVLINVGNTIFLDPEVGKRIAAGVPMEQAYAERDNSLRGMGRGTYDGRWKFIRWFATNDHHIPKDFEMLIARNDLELYDTEADPYELHNLAGDPLAHRAVLTRLNDQCNRLIAAEVGVDDGCLYTQGR